MPNSSVLRVASQLSATVLTLVGSVVIARNDLAGRSVKATEVCANAAPRPPGPGAAPAGLGGAPPVGAFASTGSSGGPCGTATTAVAPWAGVLGMAQAHASTDYQAGVRVTTVELGWNEYEPAPGQFDDGYATRTLVQVHTLQTEGFSVVLDPGLQYPPTWVFGLDASTRFVDQYGDVWHGPLGEDVANAVWDQKVRAAEAAYLDRIGADFEGSGLAAIRAGGLTDNELRYPSASYQGHPSTYWAFDRAAQAASPVPGWTPGSGGTANATAFLGWYLQSLTAYQSWLVATVRAAFPTTLIQVLYPGWGIRPQEIAAAEAGGLTGSTIGELRGSIQLGLDWVSQIGSLRDPRVEVYTTWLDAADQGRNASLESPVRYLASLAAAKALPVAGENTGQGSAAALALCWSRVRALGLAGMMWIKDVELWSGRYATVADMTKTLRA